MSSEVLEEPLIANRPASVGLLDRWGRSIVHAQLTRLRHGSVTVVDALGTKSFGHRTAQCDLHCTVFVHDASFYGDIAFGGTIGAGEAFMQGSWTCDDLPTLIRVLLVNRSVADNLESLAGYFRIPVQKLVHAWRSNSLSGSRRNIAEHYDLGNEFFALWLDETLMYSCGIFEHERSSLLEASTFKNDTICRKLELSPHDHLLEIGAGWGGFALHVAQHYGCRVTTTTVSQAQFDLAQQRIKHAGLEQRIEVLLTDYRDLTGQYDKLVSIEMIEAVGEKYLPTYFRRCSDLLRPNGSFLLQSITMPDQTYRAYRRSVDFIQRHVFPGGFLPSLGAICAAVGSSTDLRVVQLDDLTADYARTLEAWRARFHERRDAVRALGYSDTFLRMWEFYLCYCESAFRERSTGCVQLLFNKVGTLD